MGISGIPAIPMIITCLLQGILCDTGIPRTFYGGKICSVGQENNVSYQIIEIVAGIRNRGEGQHNIIAFLTYL